MSAPAHLTFRDEAHNVQLEHAAHFRITDEKSKITYGAASTAVRSVTEPLHLNTEIFPVNYV